VPPGATGELCIAGAPVARGYLNEVGDARKNFGFDIFMPGSGDRMYRSGDLVCVRSDGQLEFLGRKDGQFKFNGVRIESAEIENALNEFPGVRQAVVDLGTDIDGRKRVVAYLAVDGAEVSKSEVRRMLRQRLPDAMIPHRFYFLNALPVTANGKVDRRALAALRIEGRPAPEASMPPTATEKRMTALWEKNLSRRPIGIRHDYFELGGDSLSAVNLMAAIEKQFGVKLKSSVLFDNSNIADLVRTIEKLKEEPQSTGSVPVCGFTPLQESGTGFPLVILTGGTGTSFNHYKNFARKFAPNHPAFALQYPYALLLERSSDPLAKISDYIAEKIVEAVHDRPFVLFGHCIGAQLAWHVAAALRVRSAPPFRLVLYAPMIVDDESAPRTEAGKVVRSRLGRLLDAYRPAWEEWRMDRGTAWWTYLTFAQYVIFNYLMRRGWVRSRKEPFRFVKLSYLRLVAGSPLEVYPGDALVIHHREEVNLDFEAYWYSVCAGNLRFEFFPGNHRLWQTSILAILPLVHEQLKSLEAEESVVA
jgi:surfactin synthase thioesterase subunit/acyl carrier protein